MLVMGRNTILATEASQALLVDVDVEQGASEKHGLLSKPGSRLGTSFRRVLAAILPSFLGSRFADQKPLYGKAHPTSYLDGLRGVAAWFVFNTHLSPIISRSMGAGWGHDGVDHPSFLQLPFIHTIHAGGYPIHIFFVVGGLVSSLSAVKTMEKNPLDSSAMCKKQSSSIFKRPLRLFLPSWASTIIPFIFVRLDLFRFVEETKDHNIIIGWPILQDWPERAPSIFIQLSNWLSENLRMLRVISEGSDHNFINRYNPVLWTIPLEFQCSMFLMLMHSALFYVKQPTRIFLICATMVLTCYIGQVFLAVFWSGWLLTELGSIQTKRALAGRSTDSKPLITIAMSITLTVALYISSYPRWQPENTDGFKHLHALTPPAIGFTADFWHGLAAFLTVYCVGQLPSVAAFFSIPLFRYLGRTSLSLYLSHYWVIHIIGTIIFDHVWRLTGSSNIFSATLGFCISYSILLSITIWISDLFTRYVETPCTKLGDALTARVVTKS